jgi:hypothetical protein
MGDVSPYFGPRSPLDPYSTRRMKESGTQYDDRVVEVVWDFSARNWKILRIRDDKLHGNHKDVVTSVIESIIDGVEVDAVSIILLRGANIPDTHFNS